MNIAIISSEMKPFVITGSLGELSHYLMKMASKVFQKVAVIIPYYQTIVENSAELKIKKEPITLSVRIMDRAIEAEVFSYKNNNCVIYFIGNDFFYSREQLYGPSGGQYQDNAERFIFFSQCALDLLKKIEFQPEIIHCVDWQAGLIPVYMKTNYFEEFQNSKVVFTINNLLYQGIFSEFEMPLTNLSWDLFNSHQLEYYGNMNFMKSAVVFSDAVTVQGEHFKQFIQTIHGGCGLEEVFKENFSKIHGITHLFDCQDWNPEFDDKIPYNYHRKSLENKFKCKKKLLEEFKIKDTNHLLMGVFTRLTMDKGIDFLIDILKDFSNKNINLIFFTKDINQHYYELRSVFDEFPNRFRLVNQFDEKMIHHFFSGIDLFLRPIAQDSGSGVAHLYSMRYGVVPFLSDIPSHRNFVLDIDQEETSGNGFFFQPGNHDCFHSQFEKILNFYYNEPNTWKNWIVNCLNRCYELKEQGESFKELYLNLLKKD